MDKNCEGFYLRIDLIIKFNIMTRKTTVLVVGLCAVFSLLFAVPDASAAQGAQPEGGVTPDLAVLNSALEELKGILLRLQADLANEEVSQTIDMVALGVTLNQISLDLNSINVALNGGDSLNQRKLAQNRLPEVLPSVDSKIVVKDNGSAKALSLEYLVQYKAATFTFLALVLVFGLVVFLRRDTETESAPA